MSYIIDEAFLLPADTDSRELMRQRITDKYQGARTVNIGKSIEGREIEAYFLGRGKRCVCLFATHHALESITTNIAYLLIDYIMTMEKLGKINGIDCKLLLSKYSFIVVPCVNPDGVELHMHGASDSPLFERQMRMSNGDFTTWQANARGVDLNHNYDHRFSEYKSVEAKEGIVPGSSLYSGEYPESEPETHAVANLVRITNPLACVSLHTQGEQIFAPLNNKKSLRTAQRLADLCAYTLSVPSGTASYGGLSDYAASIGIPSFTLELGKGKNPLPLTDAPAIFKRVRDAIITLPTFI